MDLHRGLGQASRVKQNDKDGQGNWWPEQTQKRKPDQAASWQGEAENGQATENSSEQLQRSL